VGPSPAAITTPGMWFYQTLYPVLHTALSWFCGAIIYSRLFKGDTIIPNNKQVYLTAIVWKAILITSKD
jgi:hypothetical protein